ncbi:MAG: T9SS type A sorting domain-containing protein [Lentimicrobiaceae bacterium]|nr:T9SS type A sorting domain-containing protein [Lentimicrobiaceae bacterium]
MKKILSLLITITISLSVFSQDFWTPIQVPNDEYVFSVGVTKTGVTFLGTDTSFYKSYDDGLNWTKIDLEIYEFHDVFIDKDDRIFVLATDTDIFSFVVYYSLDGGNEFAKIQVPHEYIYYYNRKIYVNDSSIYIFGNNIVKKTFDFGANWSGSVVYHIPNPAPGSTLSFRKMLENKDGELFLFDSLPTESGKVAVFKSEDKGNTWDVLKKFTSSGYIIDMAFDSEETPYVLCSSSLYYFDKMASVWKSYSLPFLWSCSLAIDINDVIYITENFTGANVAKSTDGGESWELIYNNTNQTFELENLYISPNGYLYVYNKLYKSANRIFEPVQVEINNCSEFSVYPNPATNIINIDSDQFLNKEISSVVITDISGRQMKVNSVNNAQIDISNLNEGTYIITVLAGNKVYRSKFLVMR